MKKHPHPDHEPRNTHPDKEHFRKLIEQETNPDKIRQLKKEEEKHNHPNRNKKR